MKSIFWGNGDRGVACLEELLKEGIIIDLVIAHPQKDNALSSVAHIAELHGIEAVAPQDPNHEDFIQFLKERASDLFILAGYGKIFRQPLIDVPRVMCINLHGGRLPEYRGSSPLNWSLINGEKLFGLSIIKVDAGVDTGDVLLDRTFPIDQNSTIADLHIVANKEFPRMLLEVVERINNGTLTAKPQDEMRASYYPLRFPEDGFILWDMYSAEQIHNRIRGLTEPYPCAFTFFGKRKIKLLASSLSLKRYFGEPGRVYQKTGKGLLVCAQDKCLWVTKATFEDTGENVLDVLDRYATLATIRQVALQGYYQSTP